MNITFKAKLDERQKFIGDDIMLVKGYYIPKIKRSHCDMAAARASKKYGAYANSDMFERIVQRDVAAKYGDFIALDYAAVVKRGFLDEITLTLEG